MQDFLGVVIEVVKAESIDEVISIRDRFQKELDDYCRRNQKLFETLKTQKNIVVGDYYFESLKKCINFCNFNIAERQRKLKMTKVPQIDEIDDCFDMGECKF